jgi:hypothetical protein
MFDDAIDPYDTGLSELTRRLEVFADTRLSPSLSASSRMRMNVVNAAHRRAALIAVDPVFETVAVAAPALAAQRSRFASHAWRRPAAALMAGCLTLALIGGTVNAANAGGPLYAARIWIEMANLPVGALARADAEVLRLEERLKEAQQASADGDGPAAEAALAAYSAILAESVEESASDAAASAAIEVNLARHLAVLTWLVNTVPTTAQDAIRHALASSSMVLQELDDAKVGGGASNDGVSGTGATGPTGGPPAPPTKSDGTTPSATARPEKTATPVPGAGAGGHGYGNAGTPPRQADPKGTSRPDSTPRPSDKPPTGPKSEGS